MPRYKFADKEHTVINDLEKGLCGIHPGVWHWKEYQEWLAEGNVTEPFETEADKQAILLAKRQSMHCGPLEIRRALRQSGLLSSIKDFMKTAPEEVTVAWEYASVFKRMDPLVLALQASLGKTDEEVDAIFELANTLG